MRFFFIIHFDNPCPFDCSIGYSYQIKCTGSLGFIKEWMFFAARKAEV